MFFLSLLLEYCESANKTLILPFEVSTAFYRSFGACFFSFSFAGAVITAKGSSEHASTAK
jgi:hypothetical protein